MSSLLASLRLTIATLLVCVGAYTLVVYGFAQAVAPAQAAGSLIRDQRGTVVGSRLVAQAFSRPGYFWPRPSAVDYKADAAGGSNKSPTSPDLTKRATEIVARYGATTARPLPPELAAASGGGLDPHISEHAALYQAARVAAARGLSASQVEALVREHAFAVGGAIGQDRIVNVLELNLALDRARPAKG
jgi:K+-transporting ATPase ATPase C chain